MSLDFHSHPKPAPLPKKVKKPIPSKSKRKAKPKSRTICVECGEIWLGSEPQHLPLCQNAIGTIRFIKKKTEKQMYEAALDHICRLITAWRDGCLCVIDNAYCGGVSQWGHVIPQGRSKTLVYELSNSFRQCQKHNELHRHIQDPYYRWYWQTFGHKAYDALIDAWQNKTTGEKFLPQLLMQYVALYENRFQYNVTDRAQLVAAGYYGEIIQEAWRKDGKII